MRLPDPGNEYFEKETAKAWGCPWEEWQAKPAQVRADLMAHEIEKNLREAYGMEMRMKHPPKEERTDRMPWERYKDSFVKK